MILYLYKFTNTTSGGSYIGVSHDPYRRKQEHLSGNGSQKIAKMLSDDWVFTVLCQGALPYILDLERKAIKLWNTFSSEGYNLDAGGGGIKDSNTRLTEEEVVSIRKEYKKGQNQAYLAEKYSICPASISLIVRGKRYQEYPGPIAKTKCKRTTEAQKEELRGLLQEGYTIRQVADLLGMTKSTVQRHSKP